MKRKIALLCCLALLGNCVSVSAASPELQEMEISEEKSQEGQKSQGKEENQEEQEPQEEQGVQKEQGAWEKQEAQRPQRSQEEQEEEKNQGSQEEQEIPVVEESAGDSDSVVLTEDGESGQTSVEPVPIDEEHFPDAEFAGTCPR